MKHSGIAERASVGHWPRWLVVHERLPGGVFAPLRSAPFALFIAAILGYGAAFAWYMLDRFDLVNMLQESFDDPFYYYQIAYHMAEGKFSTFDGLARTNGYHPLWLFLLTPFYWVFDKTDALFAIKAFEIMLLAAARPSRAQDNRPDTRASPAPSSPPPQRQPIPSAPRAA